jgi:hypothetical protein
MPEAEGQHRGNSGVYLQERYEVQILDSFGQPSTIDGCGALYKQRRPDVNMCLAPGVWQTLDLDFRAPRYDAQGNKRSNARITVLHNGVVIHHVVELPTKTGAGRSEGPDPRPILLQSHDSEVVFRNIWIIKLHDAGGPCICRGISRSRLGSHPPGTVIMPVRDRSG